MIFESIQKLSTEKENFSIVTIIDIKGSAPQDLGAKCLVNSVGLVDGTVGGGKIEAFAINTAKEMLISEQKEKLKKVTVNLQKDIGMTCGGEVTLLFENFFFDKWNIVIFGAGHVSQALCRTLQPLNCFVTVIDPRSEWTEKLNGIADKIYTSNPVEIISQLPKDSFFISMTKGHAFDVPVLAEISKHFPKPKFIGAIGSDSKANAIKKDLLELNIEQSFIQQIKIPIGLPIGSNDPYEIAISITAQLLQLR